MNKQIFLNLPVADLPKSTAFFKALGYSFNPQFTGDSTTCVIIGETTVMLLTHPKFREFTPKAVCDTSRAVEVLISLSCESREEVDALVAKPSLREVRATKSPRISVSCICTASSTSTATGGISFT